jgi:hypothetical protein
VTTTICVHAKKIVIIIGVYNVTKTVTPGSLLMDLHQDDWKVENSRDFTNCRGLEFAKVASISSRRTRQLNDIYFLLRD